ncbi:hypothetical protein OSB04_025261 [Centaurea solstitialis]|uniref:Uncharacterized protein n=1 Tax=Centaurea solstitialis TaxID=347529 RepID=A0AA38WCX2_9ASTR|nr:hypothetical protein OSB04_025261 [Centaurea solstitialis]
MADSSSASYIHMVQHLIEKCLIFRMSKEECMEAISKHANINPVITSTGWLPSLQVCTHDHLNETMHADIHMAKHGLLKGHDHMSNTNMLLSESGRLHKVIDVWNELEKENKEFFESYLQTQSSSGANRMSEAETSELIQKIISNNQSKKDD